MPMSEALLKVELSPSNGQMFGTFTEGQPIAEAIGMVVGIQIDGKEGERIRRDRKSTRLNSSHRL